jgi:two-component system, cell cycle response regulator CpdR
MGQSKPFSRTTILVVEDDEDQRSLASTVFEEAGFRVIECENAEAAAAVIDASRGEIAMIFTDLRLPGRMDGVELARIASIKTPSVPVIVTSGAFRERVRDLPDSIEYMQKPWRTLDLFIRAERIRDGGGEGSAWRGDIL